MDEHTRATYAKTLYGRDASKIPPALVAEFDKAEKLNHSLAGSRGAHLASEAYWIVHRFMELQAEIEALKAQLAALAPQEEKKKKVA